MARYDSPDRVFYLDPLYWETTGYDSDFGFEHYTKMAELAVVTHCTYEYPHTMEQLAPLKIYFVYLFLLNASFPV